MCINSRYRHLVQLNVQHITHHNLPHSSDWRVRAIYLWKVTPMPATTTAIMYYVLPITAEGSTHKHTHKRFRWQWCAHEILLSHTHAHSGNRITQWPTSLCGVAFSHLLSHRLEWEGKMHTCISVFISVWLATTTDAKTRRYKLFLVDGFCFRPADGQMSSTATCGVAGARRVDSFSRIAEWIHSADTYVPFVNKDSTK